MPISDTPHSEEDYQRIERDLLSTQRLGRIGTWSLALETNEHIWSDELFKIFDRPRELGTPQVAEFHKMFPELDWVLLKKSIDLATTQAIPYELEVKFYKFYGGHGWLLLRGQAELGLDGTISKIYGVAIDISRQKLLEEENILQSRVIYRSLLELTDMASSIGSRRDPYNDAHERRVAKICVAIAKIMGFDEDMIEGLNIAAKLHDIGKISLPSEILTKPGKLTDAEYKLIQTHAQIGYDILKEVTFPWPIAQVVYQHHERMDGSGYPQGLRGDEILPAARIMAVADVVEAMSSHRSYRPALGIEPALAEIVKGRGQKYDSDTVDATLTLFRQDHFTLESE